MTVAKCPPTNNHWFHELPKALPPPPPQGEQEGLQNIPAPPSPSVRSYGSVKWILSARAVEPVGRLLRVKHAQPHAIGFNRWYRMFAYCSRMANLPVSYIACFRAWNARPGATQPVKHPSRHRAMCWPQQA